MFEDYYHHVSETCSSILSNTWPAHGQLSKLSITFIIISCDEDNQLQLDGKSTQKIYIDKSLLKDD